MLYRPTWITACLLTGFVFVSVAPAQSPSTQPTDEGSRGGRWMGGPSDRPRGESRRWNREVSDEEWEYVSRFMQDNFPNRWAVYQNTISKPDRDLIAKEMKHRIVSRNRQLQRMRLDNPALYDAAIEQAKADDEVWGAVKAFQELSANATDADKQATVGELRTRVRAMVEKTLSDREARLHKMREMIEEEETRLEADRNTVDRIVESRVDLLMSDNPFRGPDNMGVPPRDGMGGPSRDGDTGRPPREGDERRPPRDGMERRDGDAAPRDGQDRREGESGRPGRDGVGNPPRDGDSNHPRPERNVPRDGERGRTSREVP